MGVRLWGVQQADAAADCSSRGKKLRVAREKIVIIYATIGTVFQLCYKLKQPYEDAGQFSLSLGLFLGSSLLAFFLTRETSLLFLRTPGIKTKPLPECYFGSIYTLARQYGILWCDMEKYGIV